MYMSPVLHCSCPLCTLVKETEQMDDRSTSRFDSKRIFSGKNEAIFQVESGLLECTKVVRTQNQYPGTLKANHTNEVKRAIHF